MARIEERVTSNERQIAVYGPLPLAVERLQWTIDAINTRLDKRDRTDDERFERLARSFENQITACSSQVAQLAEEIETWQDAEQERREAEGRTEREDKSSDRTSRRAMWALLGAAAITGSLGVVVQLVQALTG